MSTKPYGEMICPVCGKTFVCHYTSTWTYRKYYKKEVLVLCSWSCLQKHNKMVEEERASRPSKRERTGKMRGKECTGCGIAKSVIFKASHPISHIPFWDFDDAFDKVVNAWNRRASDDTGRCD